TVMYDLYDLSYPPDLILDGLQIELKDIKPLIEWKDTDVFNLLKVMMFLKQAFVAQQKERLKELELGHIMFDIECLDPSKHHGIECVVSPAGYQVLIRFSTKFRPRNILIDMMDVDDGLGKTSTVTATYTLHYNIDGTEVRNKKARVTVQPSISKSLNIPAFNDKHLIDYLQEVEEAIQHSLDSGQKAADRRKDIVTLLVKEFSRQLLEYDPVNYSYCTFYFEVTEPDKKAPATAVTHIVLEDDLPPKIFLFNGTKPDNFTPHSKELKIRIHDSSSPDIVLAMIRLVSKLLEEIPLFTTQQKGVSPSTFKYFG
ncbi:hypothetical protein HDV05_007368, partial [Chytridiales sp. JEL 0842]